MKKKEFKNEVETKLHATFGHLATDVEKKFNTIVKKVAGLLTEVLHKKPVKTKTIKPKTITAKTPVKKAVSKKKAPAKVAKKAVNKKK
jgi:hypothetical protein